MCVECLENIVQFNGRVVCECVCVCKRTFLMKLIFTLQFSCFMSVSISFSPDYLFYYCVRTFATEHVQRFDFLQYHLVPLYLLMYKASEIQYASFVLAVGKSESFTMISYENYAPL